MSRRASKRGRWAHYRPVITASGGRASVPFNPLSLSPSLWLKADAGVLDGSDNPCTDGVAIKTWQDQSGNASHATQATAGNRPTYVASALNGLPAVYCNNSASQTMRSAVSAAQPATVVVAARCLVADNSFIVLFATDANGSACGWDQQATPSHFFYGSTGFSSFAPRDAAPHVFSYRATGGNGSMFYDGTQVGSTSATDFSVSGFNLATNTINNWETMYFYEVLVFPTALSDGDLASVNAYLRAKWSIPAASSTDSYIYTFNTADPTLKILRCQSDAQGGYNLAATYTPTTGCVRDPTVIKVGSTYWLTHTNPATLDQFGKVTQFAVASSTDGITFTPVANVDCTAVCGDVAGSRVWGPVWFVDSDNSVHVIVACSSTNPFDGTGFQLYETHPTNAGYTTWSTPAAITGTPANTIDGFLVKVSSTYFLWLKNETTKYVEVYSSSSPFSGYTSHRTGDWAGFGSDSEGPSVALIDGVWRAWVDKYNADGTATAVQTSGDWTSGGATAWSSLAYVGAPYRAANVGIFLL